MLLHVIDASDPDAVRSEQLRLLRAAAAPRVPLTAMPAVVVVPAMVWVTLLLVAGGLALVRARDVQQRVIALDLLAVVVVALLALLSYFWDVGYYLDAAVALSLLSFVATVAAARYLGSGGPFG